MKKQKKPKYRMDAKNQRQKILDYIAEHGSITSLEASHELNITQLASRLGELRARGFNIVGVWEESDHGKHYKRYYQGEERNDLTR